MKGETEEEEKGRGDEGVDRLSILLYCPDSQLPYVGSLGSPGSWQRRGLYLQMTRP